MASCVLPSGPRARNARRVPSGEMAAVRLLPIIASGPRSTLRRSSGWSAGRVDRHAVHHPMAATMASRPTAAAHDRILSREPAGGADASSPSDAPGSTPAKTSSTAMRASPMACSLCLQSFLRQCRISLRTVAGVWVGSALQAGSSFSTDASVSESDLPWKARLPASIS